MTMTRSMESRLVGQVTLGLSLLVIAAFSATAGASQWETRIVDAEGDVGFYTSLAFDPGDGNPSVAYSVYGADRTRFAHWNGTSWDIADVGAGRGAVTLVYTGPGAPAQ